MSVKPRERSPACWSSTQTPPRPSSTSSQPKDAPHPPSHPSFQAQWPEPSFHPIFEAIIAERHRSCLGSAALIDATAKRADNTFPFGVYVPSTMLWPPV